MSAPESAAVTPGQAAYELWAQVMAANGVDCDPYEWLGNVEQMAWREVEARQPQTAPGDLRDLAEEVIAAYVSQISYDETPADRSRVAAWQARLSAAAPSACEQPAPELAAAMAETRTVRRILATVFGSFSVPDTRRMRHASVTTATIDRWKRDAGLTGLEGK